jgi:predicted TIM-barrel fold metal-dependent hydrolase
VDLRLIDHHCHAVASGRLDRPAFESFLTESDRSPPPGRSTFDSLLGVAVRRRCAPALGLAAGADPAAYLDRRAELGPEEANRRLLSAAGLERLLVDTGLDAPGLFGREALGRLSGAITHEVVRLESVAEETALTGVEAARFGDAFTAVLADRARGAVGLKSIVAYRHGLDFDPRPPPRAELARAAGRWLRREDGRREDGRRDDGRLDDIVLLRHLLWEAVATGLPLQLHTGFGDPDLDLHRCDPSLLTPFLRACAGTGARVVLLHCYPFHRHAAYLANVFPHVYLDLGLTIPHVGPRAAAVLAETLELAPFHKLLYSSDAYGLAELYLAAADEFRDALAEVLTAQGITGRERDRIAEMMGSGTARDVYALAE